MKQILDCPTARFQNQEHYDFYTEIDELIISQTPEKLGIPREYNRFKGLLADELKALNFVRKSIYSDPLTDAVAKCRSTVLGMERHIDSYQNYYDPTAKEAAARIMILWKANKGVKSKVSKTRDGAIKKVLQEFSGNYASDVDKINLGGWVNALQTNFDACTNLGNNRYTEIKNKTPLRMETVKVQVDEAFDAIKIRINALIVVNGETLYADFVGEINQRIKTYTDNLSIRKASRKKGTKNETKTDETEDK